MIEVFYSFQVYLPVVEPSGMMIPNLPQQTYSYATKLLIQPIVHYLLQSLLWYGNLMGKGLLAR